LVADGPDKKDMSRRVLDHRPKGLYKMAKKSRPYTKDDVRFVVENYAEMTVVEISEQLGISRFQVSKIVSELGKHGMKLTRKKRENPVEIFLREELGINPVKKKRKGK